MGAVLDVADRRGNVRAVPFAAGDTLMQAIRAAGLPIAAICDGSLSCATCHVFLENAPGLVATNEDELDLLEELADYRPGSSRLSCQLAATDLPTDAIVTLAPEALRER